MTALTEVVEYLDGYLRVREIPDSQNAWNGLQVENRGSVSWIVAAVDASQATVEGVVETVTRRATREAALLLVHHGLFWDGAPAVTGRRYRRVRALLEHDIAVYSAHIPLDAHPEVGNNAVLAAAIGIESPSPFDEYRGMPFGVAGELALERDALVARLGTLLGSSPRLIPGGPPVTQRVGVITGAAGDRIRAAQAAGCDTYITGEGAHHTYFDAMELGLNVIYAGHYATEQVGVKALARHVSERFNLPWEFHDHPTGF